ncbi:MAG: PEGA domain-containing protein [bacterium]
MKNIWLYIAIVCLSCSKAQLPIAPELKTTIEITAINLDGQTIDSVQVYLDGKLAGLTPYTNSRIQTGLHSFRLMKEGFLVYTHQLLIEEGQFYNIEAVLSPLPSNEGELLITVNLESTLVVVKDVNENTVVETHSQSSSHILPTGAYIVSGEKPGLPKVVKAVDVHASQTSIVNLELALPEDDPPSLEFIVAEDTVQIGAPINLSWQSNGYQVILDQGIGIRGPSGSEKVICNAPGMKVFTATAYGKNNLTTSKTDTVLVVVPAVEPPSLTFSVLADSVEFGDPVQIEWSSNGYQVVIDHGVGARGPIGSEELFFKNPGKKVFTATAYGENNVFTIVQDSVYIKEAENPTLPVIMLTTTPTVSVNSPATITWFSQNADYVVVDYVDNADLQGSVTKTFSTPGTRFVTATAFNQAGYSTVSDTIEVVEPPVVAVDDIIVATKSFVRADKGEAGMVDRKAATFEITTPGKYRIYTEAWYNSGDAQLNESFYLEVRDDSNGMFFPKNPNAGLYKVVADDPGEPHTASRESGVFQLSAGTHYIDVNHYAKIAEFYPQFLNGSGITGPESIKLLGFKLKYEGE